MRDIFYNLYKYVACYNYNINKSWNDLIKDIERKVYCEVFDLQGGEFYDFIKYFDSKIAITIKNDDYDQVLTIIEFLLNWTEENFKIRHYSEFNEKKYINKVFENECVGYRFINKYIVPITDEIESSEIEQSINTEYQGCRSHINKALLFLSDRDKRDYKNSIKESISAVESICCIIADKKTDLNGALKILEQKNNLKGQLKSAFEKLYNYTSGQGGIRHAEGLFESDVSYEEAKFMLVSCCAFINYLIAEHKKILEHGKKAE